MRYFLELSYDGTDFHGWQRQPNVVSVQECLESCLEKVLKQPTPVFGCGRTDAGVHARAYIAHINVDSPLADSFLHKLNYALPESIAVHRFWEVSTRYHAQFAATGRTYHYYLHTRKNPFAERFSTYWRQAPAQIAWEEMRAAAACLQEYQEFRPFCKVPERHDSTICHVSAADFVQTSPESFYFRITATRFLRGMVRLITAQLMEVGAGRQSAAAFENYLKTSERPRHFIFAPPQGLFLDNIAYPDKISASESSSPAVD